MLLLATTTTGCMLVLPLTCLLLAATLHTSVEFTCQLPSIENTQLQSDQQMSGYYNRLIYDLCLSVELLLHVHVCTNHVYVDIHVHILASSPATPDVSVCNIEELGVAGDEAIHILCGCMIGIATVAMF